MTQQRESGKVKTMRTMEMIVSKCAHIPCPSSHAGTSHQMRVDRSPQRLTYLLLAVIEVLSHVLVTILMILFGIHLLVLS